MRIGDDRVRKTSAQNLRRQFDLATFKEGESVEDYALRLNSMAVTLTTLGDKIEERQVVEKIIRSVPNVSGRSWSPSLVDVSTLTVADLTGRLKAAEDAFEETPSSMHHEGKLYLTEEEWNARQKKQYVGRGSSNSARRGRRGVGQPEATRRKCEKLGHWARECRSKSKKEQAHVVQEEEGASLFFVESTPVISTSRFPYGLHRAGCGSARVSTFSGDFGGTDRRSRTVMFQCKNGKHGLSEGVFHSRLTANIISVGQQRGGYQVDIERGQ
ncbi:uncharacterized protein LOC144715771 [Wolffia australiana]